MTLDEKRRFAAAVTKGTSSEPCYALAERLLREAGAGGRLLEFGAGAGRFALRLASDEIFQEVVCTDILPRPSAFPNSIEWIEFDLNHTLPLADGIFDTIVSVEVIEHLENPRAVFREFHRVLKSGGLLVLTTPNQESLRSYAGLVFGGHFASFLGASYPAHITALLRMDFERICSEAGFGKPRFAYSGDGRIPKLTHWCWQKFFPLLRGRLFSDNFGMSVRK